MEYGSYVKTHEKVYGINFYESYNNNIIIIKYERRIMKTKLIKCLWNLPCRSTVIKTFELRETKVTYFPFERQAGAIKIIYFLQVKILGRKRQHKLRF